MFGSQVLEVMIGLLLIYLALSVACSGIKEVIASLLALRAKTLKSAIANMLQDSDLTREIFQHPLISGTAPPGQMPSYISARDFATALFDVIAATVPASPPAGPGAAADGATASAQAALQDVLDGISKLPAPLRKTLGGFIKQAHGDLGAAQLRTQAWFDDTMQRVSGWYKRTAQKVIFCVAVAVCLALNADTFGMAKELWSDEAVRTALVSEDSIRIQVTAAVRAAASNNGGNESVLGELKNEIQAGQSLPLGWSREAEGWRSSLLRWPGGLAKLLGILVTSFAILLGAPFWFDLLNTVINLRLTGEPPATQQTAGAPVSASSSAAIAGAAQPARP
jgi:hypothetical protein